MPAWLAAIGPVVQGITGIVQAASAAKAAKNLPEAQKYEATPQMKRAEEMALRRAEQGMSSAERALFEQGMARRTGAAERSLRNLGLAGLGVGMSNIFNIDAQNQFSAQSEAERRKGEAMYAGIASQMQGIQDRETSSFNQMLQQQRTALGQAAASGMKNITGAAGMASQMIHTENLAKKYGNSGDTINIVNNSGGPAPQDPPPVPDPILEKKPSIDSPGENNQASAYNNGMNLYGVDPFGMNPYGVDPFSQYV